METLASGEPAFKRDSLPVRNHRPPDPALATFGEMVEARRRRDWRAAKRLQAEMQGLGWLCAAIAPKGRGAAR